MLAFEMIRVTANKSTHDKQEEQQGERGVLQTLDEKYRRLNGCINCLFLKS